MRGSSPWDGPAVGAAGQPDAFPIPSAHPICPSRPLVGPRSPADGTALQGTDHRRCNANRTTQTAPPAPVLRPPGTNLTAWVASGVGTRPQGAETRSPSLCAVVLLLVALPVGCLLSQLTQPWRRAGDRESQSVRGLVGVGPAIPPCKERRTEHTIVFWRPTLFATTMTGGCVLRILGQRGNKPTNKPANKPTPPWKFGTVRVCLSVRWSVSSTRSSSRPTSSTRAGVAVSADRERRTEPRRSTPFHSVVPQTRFPSPPANEPALGLTNGFFPLLPTSTNPLPRHYR